MKNSFRFIYTLLFLLFFLSGCNQPPKMDIAEALTLSEEKFKELEGIECVSAFDGETVKFRLILDEEPTEKEATKLFEEMLETVASYTSHPDDMWDFYKAKFDLAFGNGIIYEGNKETGKDLIVKPI
jgi:hypothetical protein